MTRTLSSRRTIQPLLIGVLAFAPIGYAQAWQSSAPPAARPLLVAPPPVLQFQQIVQQQQVADQLQKSQQQQRLQQGVSDNAKRPSANDPLMLRQLDQADQAQRNRDRAAQQDAIDRYRNQATLPRVIPQGAPASSRSGR
ncbi:MAG: hypothetical protein ABI128_07115 [Rhodanobacter sp.]